MKLSSIATEYDALWYGSVADQDFIIMPLAFHVALIQNPQPVGGYEERYCFHNKEIALIALEEFKNSGKIKYWKKWHSKDISIACGNLAFKQGVLHTKGQEAYSVDWNVDDLSKKFPYSNPSIPAFLRNS